MGTSSGCSRLPTRSRPDVDVAMLVPQDDVAIRRRVTDRGHAPLEAAGDTPARVAAVAAASTPFDVVVLDGYVFDVALQRRLRDRAPLSVVDDLGLPSDCDLAVNPVPRWRSVATRRGRAPFSAARHMRSSDGPLWKRASSRLRRGRQPRTVLVSTGATDPTGLGRSVSHALLDRDPDVRGHPGRRARLTDVDEHARSREQLLEAPPDLADASRDGHRLCRRRGHDGRAGRMRRVPGGDHARGEQPAGAGRGARGSRLCRRCGCGESRGRVPCAPR